MSNDFGSPEQGDATARFEKLVNDSAQRLITFVRDKGPQILNRAPGTVPIDAEGQLLDFQEASRNPQALQAIHAQRTEQVGQRQATVELIRWFRKNQKRMK